LNNQWKSKTKMKIKAIGWVILSIFPLPAIGAVLTMDELAACNKQSSQDEDCFRQIINNKTTVNTSVDSNPNWEGIWLVGKQVHPNTGKTLHSVSTYNQFADDKTNAEFIALCDDGKTVFFVNWNQRIASFGEIHKVTYQMDDKPTRIAEAIILTGDSTQFLEPMPLLKEIVATKAFTASVVNLAGNTVTALFDSKEAGQALAGLRQACNW